MFLADYWKCRKALETFIIKPWASEIFILRKIELDLIVEKVTIHCSVVERTFNSDIISQKDNPTGFIIPGMFGRRSPNLTNVWSLALLFTRIPIINPVLIVPVITPFVAYMTYDDIARFFNYVFDVIALERNWVPVDGGAYQARIIAPAINGIVVPAISILFATLTSKTVSSLRQRQIDIHAFLNTESGDLRLSILVDAFPQSVNKSRCREYLRQYTCRLIAESKDSKTSKVMFGSTDSQMNAFVATLNELAIDADESGL